MKSLSPEAALYLYQSSIWPCMEYCGHVWTGAPSCYLDMLSKLQKRVCKTATLTLGASLKPLGHRKNVGSQIIFYTYYFGRCLSELTKLVPLPYSSGRFTRCFDRLRDYLSLVLDAIRMTMSTVSFLAQLGSRILCLQNNFF